jgi:hypothetical protein
LEGRPVRRLLPATGRAFARDLFPCPRRRAYCGVYLAFSLAQDETAGVVSAITSFERLVRKTLRTICGRGTVGALHEALECLVRPLLFLATLLVFCVILFWFPSKVLVIVLFLLFLVLIGLM